MRLKKVKNLLTEEELKIYPIEKAHTISSQWYSSPDLFEFENTSIFKESWQYVCHTDQIKKPGDAYFAEIAKNPVIVFRDSENKIRAFFNVCKHRGGPLAIKKGTKTVLQCQYHGWTYLDDGSLRGVPDWNKVELFDKKDFGLEPVEFKIWEGLIFVRITSSSLTIHELLKDIPGRISPIKLENLLFHSEETYEVNCNWKVYVDNFLEGYHIPIVHPELANMLDYREYVTETSDWHSLQHSPFKSDENLYSASGGEAFYYFVFPNIMLNILPGRLQMNTVIPVSPGFTKVIFSYFYDDISSKKGMIREDISYSHQIQMEDIEICEAVQRGLSSLAYDKGRFSVKRELGVYHFQSLMKKIFQQKLIQADG